MERPLAFTGVGDDQRDAGAWAAVRSLVTDNYVDLTVASGAEITGDGRLFLDSGDGHAVRPPHPGVGGALRWNLTANGALSVGALTMTSGTLSVTGDVTVTDTLEWDGVSTMTGEGTTIIEAGATATVAVRFYLAGGPRSDATTGR